MKSTPTFVAAALVLGLAACGASPAAPGGESSPTRASASQVRIVASTNVYGSIAQAVGGNAVMVTSIIEDPDRDPHEYEADAQNQLALSKAQIVMVNGGGYDDFVTSMLRAAPTRATVLNAVDLSGYDQHPTTGEFNEHVWYDFPTVVKVARQLASDLGTASPGQADQFRTNADSFTSRVTALEQQLAGLKKVHAGAGVALTEPVPLYLLNAAGLHNKTPPEFSRAIETATDVTPSVLRATEELFTQHQVELLAYNEQTTGPQTEAVLQAAKANAVPVVPVTETLPAGQDYLTWMDSNVEALARALGP